jgi:hypothetical protein
MKIIIGSEGMGHWGAPVINQLICKLYPDAKIEYSNNDNCNFIIKSVFGMEHSWNKNMKKYIYWSGENYNPSESGYQTEKLYMITTLNNNIDNLYIPFFLYANNLYKERIILNNDRKYLLAYCNSNPIKEREEIFNLFVEKTSDKLCHSYGNCFGNYSSTRKQKAPGNAWNNELINIYKDYKFVIAMENSCVDGYVTEKIINAYYSGAIPIYWGSSNINDFFNKDAFINVNNFKSFEECVNYVINMSETKRKEMLNQSFYNNTDLVNLLNDSYNSKKKNKVLNEYLKKIKIFLEEPIKKPIKLEEPIKKPVKLEEPIKKQVKLEEPIKKPIKLKEPIKKPAKLEEPVKKPAKVKEPIKKPAKVEKPIKKLAKVEESLKKLAKVKNLSRNQLN